jgi:hypothetical protein
MTRALRGSRVLLRSPVTVEIIMLVMIAIMAYLYNELKQRQDGG